MDRSEACFPPSHQLIEELKSARARAPQSTLALFGLLTQCAPKQKLLSWVPASFWVESLQEFSSEIVNFLGSMETISERPPPAPSRPPRPSEDLRSKEQRRRERRERRAARRQQQNYGHFRGHDPFTIYGSVYGSNMPDILNSHLPPPAYSTLPQTARTTRSGTSGQPQVGSSPASGPPPTVRSARPRRWRPLPNLTGVTTDLQR